jgi:transcriptional regulator with XRE-family HTH domain
MANSHGREDFSKRLREAFQRGGVDIDSPTRLASEFSDRYSGNKVSQQAVRKWLNGEAIPSQEKIQALAAWLNVGTEWLRYGKGGTTTQQTSPAYRIALSDQELVKRFRKLSHRQQQAVSEIIIALATKA